LANARIASFIAVSLPVREASYFVLKAKCAAIVVADAAACLGQLLVSHLSTAHQVLLPYVRIAPHLQTAPLASTDITISSNRYLDDNAAALIIFTSGTTGPPKGAVMRRGFLHDNCEPIIGHFQITEMDVVLHVLPVHHATGIGITFLPFLHAGSCVEFRSGSVDIAWLWERWKQGGVDFFSGVPTMYIAGARSMRGLICGTSALPSPVAKFWTSILGGNRRIITRYGATEIGPVFTSAVGSTEEVPEGSVGPVFPGVTVKLSDGEEGEILVKSPYMFAR
jgi:malonyl-CoA/methylmalonyl-CoA synthetase